MTRAEAPSRKPLSPKGRLAPKLSSSGTVVWKGFEDEALDPRNAFQLKEASSCVRCGRTCLAGEFVFLDKNRRVVGAKCCARQEELSGLGGSGVAELDELTPEDIEGRDFVPLSQVLPHGKTRADMCHGCFQIKSSNNACGC